MVPEDFLNACVGWYLWNNNLLLIRCPLMLPAFSSGNDQWELALQSHVYCANTGCDKNSNRAEWAPDPYQSAEQGRVVYDPVLITVVQRDSENIKFQGSIGPSHLNLRCPLILRIHQGAVAESQALLRAFPHSAWNLPQQVRFE